MKTIWVCIILTLGLSSGRRHLNAHTSFRTFINNAHYFISTDIDVVLVLVIVIIMEYCFFEHSFKFNRPSEDILGKECYQN